MQCLFTLPGRHSKPFIYKVERVRDGRGYCARSVTVRQPDENGSVDKSVVCFITICSFKRAEEGTFEHQEERRLEEKYSSVLRGKRPQDHPPAPVVDVPWWAEHPTVHHSWLTTIEKGSLTTSRKIMSRTISLALTCERST